MAEITMIEAIRQAMSEEMARDETVVLLGEDVGDASQPLQCDPFAVLSIAVTAEAFAHKPVGVGPPGRPRVFSSVV